MVNKITKFACKDANDIWDVVKSEASKYDEDSLHILASISGYNLRHGIVFENTDNEMVEYLKKNNIGVEFRETHVVFHYEILNNEDTDHYYWYLYMTNVKNTLKEFGFNVGILTGEKDKWINVIGADEKKMNEMPQLTSFGDE